MSIRDLLVVVVAVSVCVLGPSRSLAQDSELETGEWFGFLASHGGQLPLRMEVARSPDGQTVHFINGEERVEVPVVEIEGQTATLEWDYYDARIVAQIYDQGATLKGSYYKTRRGGEIAEMPFFVRRGDRSRFSIPPTGADDAMAQAVLNERWRIVFEDGGYAVADFEAEDASSVRASLRTPTGDYRYLWGTLTRGELLLATFDGAHAFLFKGRLTATPNEDPERPDLKNTHKLEGMFWSGRHYQTKWTAAPEHLADLGNPYLETEALESVDWRELEYVGLDGETVALGEPELSGKARIIELFGTWCPNCYDASRLLKDLHERYASEGLAITALAFEHTGNLERDLRVLRTYRDRLEIPYTLLLAGTSGKEEASERFPVVDRVRAVHRRLGRDPVGVHRLERSCDRRRLQGTPARLLLEGRAAAGAGRVRGRRSPAFSCRATRSGCWPPCRPACARRSARSRPRSSFRRRCPCR